MAEWWVGGRSAALAESVDEDTSTRASRGTTSEFIGVGAERWAGGDDGIAAGRLGGLAQLLACRAGRLP